MEFFFTVFTPVYNRKHTINRVWESLNKQTYENFEWIIVNDGSTDGIKSLLQEYKEKANFEIKIFHQENGGKHIAFNRAVDEARGDLFIPADSDDRFSKNTIKFFNEKWRNHYKELNVSGISVLCQNEDESITGEKFPFEGISDYMTMTYKNKVWGEKWGCIRTDILRMYKFPDLRGGYFPESFIWAQIGINYKTLFFNIPLRTYYQDAGNQIMKVKDQKKSALDIKYYYYSWWLNEIFPKAYSYLSIKDGLKYFVSMWKYSFKLNKPIFQVLNDINNSYNKVILLVLYIPSLFLFRLLRW